MARRLDIRYFSRHVLVPWTIAAAMATAVFYAASGAPWVEGEDGPQRVAQVTVDQ